jgi:hypothetical protein
MLVDDERGGESEEDFEGTSKPEMRQYCCHTRDFFAKMLGDGDGLWFLG